MSKNTKRLTRLAALAAIGVAFLFLGSVLPSARLAVTALTGFFAAAALLMYGFGWALGVYAITAALSLLLLPAKLCAILYTAFFGLYPLLKAFLESRIKPQLPCWAAKLGVYTLAFAVWWLITAGIGLPEGLLSHWYVLWPLGAAAFAVYDICFSFLIKLYIQRISGYFQ